MMREVSYLSFLFKADYIKIDSVKIAVIVGLKVLFYISGLQYVLELFQYYVCFYL